MNIAISGKIRNYIFTAWLVLILFCLVIAFSAAVAQNKNSKDNYIRYHKAVSLMKQQQYAQAEELFAGLDSKFWNSYQVQYQLGLCSAALGDYNAAVNYMQQAQEIRPALVMDRAFLSEYGQYLYLQGDYARAKIYLLESKKYSLNPEDTLTADKYLGLINNNDKGDR